MKKLKKSAKIVWWAIQTQDVRFSNVRWPCAPSDSIRSLTQYSRRLGLPRCCGFEPPFTYSKLR